MTTMRIEMTANLGLHDADRLGLDPAAATEGATIDAPKAAAEELLKRGFAVAAVAAPALKAVPAAPGK